MRSMLSHVILSNPDDRYEPYTNATPLPVTISDGATASNQSTIARHTATSIVHNNRVKLGSANATSVIGGESTPIRDPDGRNGWLFKKLANDATKINFYYYSEGNTAFTLNDIQSLTAMISVNNYQNADSLPFFVVYTKPTGVGDGGAWYHSAVKYHIDSNIDVIMGELVEIYAGSEPTDNNINKRKLSWNTKSVVGDGLPEEEILTISLHTDSGALMNTEILVSYLGFIFNKDSKLIKSNLRLTV